MAYEDLDFTIEEYEQLMLKSPKEILEDVNVFRWGLEHLFFILNKHEEIVPLTLNLKRNSLQHNKNVFRL